MNINNNAHIKEEEDEQCDSNDPNNDYNNLPQSYELSDQDEENIGIIESNNTIKNIPQEEYDVYPSNEYHQVKACSIFIKGINIIQPDQLKEMEIILQGKDKQIVILNKQNDQLKKTISNLVIQSKQNKKFDKIGNETKIVSYADMILSIPLYQKELELKKNHINELDKTIDMLNITIKNNDITLKEREKQLDSMEKSIDVFKKDNATYHNELQLTKTALNLKTNETNTSMLELNSIRKMIEKRTAAIIKPSKQQESFSLLHNTSDDIEERQRILHDLYQQIKTLKQENEVLIVKARNYEEQINDNTTIIKNYKQNESILNNQLASEIKTLDQYKDEITNLNNQIIYITTEKTKNETFYLNQIAQIQSERNYYENLTNNTIVNIEKDNKQKTLNLPLHSTSPSSSIIINHSQTPSPINNQAEVLEDISNTLNEITLVMNQLKSNKQLNFHEIIYILLCNNIKTLDISYSCITNLNNDLQSYRNDNKKLFDYNHSLTDLNKYYISFFNRILTKHMSNESIVTIIKSLLAANYQKEQLQKERIKLKAHLATYATFIQKMNTSLQKQTNDIIGNRIYSLKDFGEISDYQNELMGIEIKLNQVHSDIITLEKELSSYE